MRKTITFTVSFDVSLVILEDSPVAEDLKGKGISLDDKKRVLKFFQDREFFQVSRVRDFGRFAPCVSFAYPGLFSKVSIDKCWIHTP